jgi:hypothetical protein
MVSGLEMPGHCLQRTGREIVISQIIPPFEKQLLYDLSSNGVLGLPNPQHVRGIGPTFSALVRNGGRKAWPHYAHPYMLLWGVLIHRVQPHRSCTLLLDRKNPLFISNITYV